MDFEEHSTNYLEIYWGPRNDACLWSKDSLYIAGEIFDSLGGMRLLRRSGALPHFDFYDVTVVTRDDWKRMNTILTAMGGSPANFVAELAGWIGDGFETNETLIISGV